MKDCARWREVPTGSGPLDLLYMNSKGYLTLVETKLWRNPEARRTVVAQIIDYAKRMSSWTYEDLRSAVLSSRMKVEGSDPLMELARADDEDFDDREFIDRVNRNLRLGRFVLLIVGDGIHEGVEQMADFLNQTPQLQFRLGLIEMGMYRVGNSVKHGEFFVQPRLLARTREVVRAVVEIQYRTDLPHVSVSVPLSEGKGGTRGPVISRKEFLEELKKNTNEKIAALAERALDEADSHDLTVAWGNAGAIFKYEDPDTGHEFTFGQFNRSGYLSGTWRLYHRLNRLKLPHDVADDYLNRLQNLIPNSKPIQRKTKRGPRRILSMGSRPKKDAPPLEMLLERQDEWFEIIDETIDRLRDLLADHDGE